jgi:hypothetical protein
MEYYRAGINSVREAGFMALRTLITLNSGAFVVLLTFIGNTAAQSQFIVPLEKLQLGMYSFLSGLVFTFFSLGQTYILNWNSTPYFEPGQNSKVREFLGLFAYLLFPLLSCIAFVIGVLVVVSNVGYAR